MKRNMKQRLIAMICIIGMLCSVCYVNGPKAVEASTDTITTLDGLMKAGFTPWTFQDVGIDEQTITGDLNKTTAPKSSLDKTIFHGKILFPEGSGDDFGHFYIGGSYNDEDSKWTGIRITGHAATALKIQVTDEKGTVLASNNIWQQSTYNALRGNSELQLAISVEYLDVTKDGLVTLKVGVFVDGVLHLGNYYTYSNVPEQCLTKNVKWLSPSGSPAVKSDSLVDITLENAPERNFNKWSFDTVGISDQIPLANNYWDYSTAKDVSLDKSIFVANIDFKNTYDNWGSFYIGGPSVAPGDGSKHRGFKFEPNGTDKLYFSFCTHNGAYLKIDGTTAGTAAAGAIAVFDSETAGTTLRANENLQVALSVEYVSGVTDGLVDIQIGVFFDGVLYDNTYYTLKSVPEELLRQSIRANGAIKAISIASDRIGDIMLEDAPENDFEEWTLSDTGFEDQEAMTSNFNWERPATTVESLDKTLFNAKVYFPAGSGNDIGNFYIGGTPNTSKSKYSGFLIRGANSTAISFAFQDEAGTIINIANLFSETAETDLRGNKNLQFSMSTEVLSVTDGLATVKIGLFFDGKLYNNEYFTKSGLAEACLTRFVKWYGPKSSDIKSIKNNIITLENAKEKDYTYWSFRDVNISDYTFAGTLQNKKPTYTESLDKTIFNAKVSLYDGGSFGKLYIGGSVDENSAERGLALRGNSKTDEINVVFQGEGGAFYDKNGVMASGGPFLYCRPEIAGVTLRGNSDLQISVSFTIVEEDAETGLVSVEIGIFFNGKLYNNEYYTLKDIDPAYLTRNINWHSGASGATNQAASLGKAKNVAAAGNGGSVSVSHMDVYSEAIGYGVDTLIDGVVGQNDPYYLGVTGTDVQNEETTLEFTFDDTYIVDHIQMYKKFGAGGFPTDFTVDAYTKDGWKTVATETDYASITGWNEIAFTDTECSAIRIHVTENGKEKGTETYGLHLTEVQIWGAATLANIETPQQMSEEAVALSFATNDDAINDGVVEGNQGLRVVADTQTESTSIQMMFDTAMTATGVSIFSQNAGEFPSDFDIYAFTGSKWELVKSVTDYAPSTTRTMHTFDFDSAVTCSSIMVVVTKLCDIYAEGGAYGLQFQEMRVEGVSNEKGCGLLGDADVNDDLVNEDDMDAFRTTLASAEPTESFDVNMDGTKDSRDLVRMKRYFAAEEAKERTYDITAMSFNILGFKQEGYEDQAVRGPHIANYILEQETELVGIQEAGGQTYDWAGEFDTYLCENGPYASVKISDEEIYQTTNEYYKESGNQRQAPQSGLIIYYKKARFTLLDSGAQQYSVGQTYLGENIERWFQWAKLLDKKTGEVVYMTNTHWSANLDDAGNEDFEAGATFHVAQSTELLAFWKETVGDNILVATGDYNAYQDTEAIATMNSDIYKEANVELDNLHSLKNHIDHIFVNPQKTTVHNWYLEKATFDLDGTACALSDHYPIFAELSYKK